MSFATDAKMLRESGLLARLAAWDLVVVETRGEECYCYCLEDLLLAYPGLKGFGSFVRSYQGARADSSPLEQFNEKITQDLVIISFDGEARVMRKYPLQDPQPLADTAQADDICRALLAAKPIFDQYPAKAAWCEANHLAGEVENWAPKVSLEGKVGVCEASKLDLSTDWAVATLRDGDVVGKLVQKRQPDTLVKVSTFVCPLPLGPKYPMAQLLYDVTRKAPINAFMVDDFDKEHTSFVDHFISYCAQDGIPGAMVCRDERAYYLYQEVARVLGFKIALDRGADQEMDAVSEGYVHAMADMMRQGEEDHHCHHDHESGHCHCHDHEGGGCGCHHDHDGGHCHCHE